MRSRFLCSLVNLLFPIFIWTTLCSNRVSSKNGSLKIESTFKGIVKHSNPVSEDFTCNKMKKMIRFIGKRIIPPCISSPIVSKKALIQTFAQHTGYIPIKCSYGARFFYFFFESISNKDAPVVLWLNGGPGASSALSLFSGNGPFDIKAGSRLKRNDFALDKEYNLLYVDHYIGTGFSYSSDHRDMRNSSSEVSKDLYDFLQGFFEVYPKLLENDFYIIGASYVGHIAPILASQLLKKNKNKENTHINLKGVAISNGHINPEYKYSSYPDFVYANKLVSRSSYRVLKRFNKECLTLIYRCQTQTNVCKDAKDICIGFYNRMRNVTGNAWHYDVRKFSNLPVNFRSPTIEKFLASNHVRKALGVEKRVYVMFNEDVLEAMSIDSMVNYAGVIPELLEDGIKILIFDGEYDLICNWLGNFRLMEAIKWNDRNQFLKTKLTSYKLDGKKIGEVKNVGPLTFIKVFDAGHGVTVYQPHVSLQILKNWINS